MERLARLREALRELDGDALLISEANNRRYVTGFSGSAGLVLVSRDAARLLVDFRYTEQARQQAAGFEVRQYDDPYQALAEACREDGFKRVAFEADHLSVSQHRRLGEKVPAVEWVPSEGVVERLRAVKDEGELARIQRAVDLADRAFLYLLGRLQGGRSERELALELETFLRREGAEALSFTPIVASGPRSALPHARPSERCLARGDFVVLDFGAVWEGYCSDMTRTVVVGPPTDRHRDIYELVRRAHGEGLAGVRAGRAARAVDAQARRVIEEAGHGEHFGHGLGHGVGLAVHEEPSLSTRSEWTLAEAMVTSVEPGVYVPGWGGVRIEDLVVVEEEGCRVLTRSPKDLIVVPG